MDALKFFYVILIIRKVKFIIMRLLSCKKKFPLYKIQEKKKCLVNPKLPEKIYISEQNIFNN